MKKQFTASFILLIAVVTRSVLSRQNIRENLLPNLSAAAPRMVGDIQSRSHNYLLSAPPSAHDLPDALNMDSRPVLPSAVRAPPAPPIIERSEPSELRDRSEIHPPAPPSIERSGINPPAPPSIERSGIHPPAPPSIERSGIHPPAPPSIERSGILPPSPPSIERSVPYEPRACKGVCPPAQPRIITSKIITNIRTEVLQPAPPQPTKERACVYLHNGNGSFLKECRDINESCSQQACGENEVCGVNLDGNIQCFDSSVREFENCRDETFRLQQPCPADAGIVGFGQGCTFCKGTVYPGTGI